MVNDVDGDDNDALCVSIADKRQKKQEQKDFVVYFLLSALGLPLLKFNELRQFSLLAKKIEKRKKKSKTKITTRFELTMMCI